MLIQLGQRRAREPDGVDLLLDCHARIRAMLALARRLAAATDVAPSEVRAAAGQVRRYFSEALPLHALDEEDLVPAALAGQREHGTACAQLARDHRDHEPLLAALIAHWAALEQAPERMFLLAAELGTLTEQLTGELLAHLELEERTISPALRALPAEARLALAEAIRARRRS